jgi:hypothetical protein
MWGVASKVRALIVITTFCKLGKSHKISTIIVTHFCEKSNDFYDGKPCFLEKKSKKRSIDEDMEFTGRETRKNSAFGNSFCRCVG